jgi:hypothetical protein
MSFRKRNTVILWWVFACLTAYNASAANWDSCADDLDRLRRSARDASDKANEVKAKSEEVENCKRYPDMYDLMRDRCRSKLSEYQSTLRDLESELGTVDSRIRSARLSCGFDLGSIGSPSYSQPSQPGTTNPVCDVYRGYRNKLPLETLVQTCMKSMSEAECRKCLTNR